MAIEINGKVYINYIFNFSKDEFKDLYNTYLSKGKLYLYEFVKGKDIKTIKIDSQDFRLYDTVFNKDLGFIHFEKQVSKDNPEQSNKDITVIINESYNGKIGDFDVYDITKISMEIDDKNNITEILYNGNPVEIDYSYFNPNYLGGTLEYFYNGKRYNDIIEVIKQL